MSIAFENTTRRSGTTRRYSPINRVKRSTRSTFDSLVQDAIALVSLIGVVAIIASLFWQQ